MMKHALPPLDSLKVFEAAARRLSFSRAAEELCLTKSAVSYQIQKLERHLGRPLFKRAARQVLLTDAGQQLLQTTQRLFGELTDALTRLESAVGHNIAIAATTYVAARWLSPRLAGFIDRYPNVTIKLQHAVNSAEFALEDVDIAIRWGRCGGSGKQDQDQPHRVLAELPMALFPACSPLLRARLGPRPTLQSLADCTLLCEDRPLDLWQEWVNSVAGRFTLRGPRRVIVDANVRAQAAVDGQGLVLADELMRSELDSGALLAPFGVQRRLDGYGYALVSAPIRRCGPEAAALRDWLVKMCEPTTYGGKH